MRRVAGVFRQPEFQIFLFCLMFALFNWPFLAVAGRIGFETIFLYLYGLWLVLILLLFFLQKSIRGKETGGNTTEKGDG